MIFDRCRQSACSPRWARVLVTTARRTDYKFPSIRGSSREYKLNVCGPVKSDLWNVKADPDKVGAVFRGDAGDLSMGAPNVALEIVDDAPTAFLVGGSVCPAGGDKARMSTAIRFVCDSSAGVGECAALFAVAAHSARCSAARGAATARRRRGVRVLCRVAHERALCAAHPARPLTLSQAACGSGTGGVGGLLVMFLSMYAEPRACVHR